MLSAKFHDLHGRLQSAMQADDLLSIQPILLDMLVEWHDMHQAYLQERGRRVSRAIFEFSPDRNPQATEVIWP